MVLSYTAREWASKRLLLFKMIVCVCNNISEGQIRKDPSLLEQCATNCGICSDTVESLQAELFTNNIKKSTTGNSLAVKYMHD